MNVRILSFLALTLFASPLWAQSGIDGDWQFTMNSPFAVVNAKVTLITDGDSLSGEFDLGNGRVWPIEEGSVSGSHIYFRLTRDSANVAYGMSAEIAGDTVNGFAIAMGTSIAWTMTRQ